jgi:hypothetical protein
MPFVKINGITYDFDTLSDDIKNHLKHLAYIDGELERMSMQANVLRISREEIGRRVDADLLRMELNAPGVPTDAPPGLTPGSETS